MTAVVLLFAVGFLLIAVEIIAPGGILGLFGGLFLLAGCAVSFSEFGLGGGSVATAIAMCVGAAVIVWEFVYLPKTKLAKNLAMSGTVSGRSQPELATEAIVGEEGKSLTLLNPSGYAEIGKNRFEVFSRRGQVEPETKIKVVGIDNFRIIVTPVED